MWKGHGAESRDFVYDEETRPFGTNPLDIVASYREGVEITLTGDFDGSLQLDDIALSANGNRLVFMGVMPAGESVDLHDEGLGLPGAVTLMPKLSESVSIPFTTLAFAFAGSRRSAAGGPLDDRSACGNAGQRPVCGRRAPGIVRMRPGWHRARMCTDCRPTALPQTRKMTLIK